MPAYIKPNILPWSHYFAGFIELSSCCSVFFPQSLHKSPSAGILSYCWQMYTFWGQTDVLSYFFFIFLKKQEYLNWKQITQHRWLRKHLLQVQFCKCQGRCCVNCNQPGGPYKSVFQNFWDLTRMSMSNISEKTMAMNKKLYNENFACNIRFVVITRTVNKHQWIMPVL